MKPSQSASRAFCLAILLSSPATAQTALRIRDIGPTLRTSVANRLGSAASVRQTSAGDVFVIDIVRRQLLLFDSTLSTATVVLDSNSIVGGQFRAQAGGIIPYTGDSLLFVDPASLSMLVIDPTGRIARVMAAPRLEDAAFLVGGPFGTPVTDVLGRLVFRGSARPRPVASAAGTLISLPIAPDSVPIVRMDFTTRRLDTLAMYKVATSETKVSRDETGRLSVTTTVNPMQTVDDWAVLSDGSLAMIRGRDYHIDWIRPDGTTASAPKFGFAWHRMSEEDKTAVLDSAQVAIDKSVAAASARVLSNGTSTSVAERASVARAPAGPTISLVSTGNLPEYRPAFAAGAARADHSGNVWIRTSERVGGSAVYDVVNRTGIQVDRVKLKPGRIIVGFGLRGTTMFLAFLDGADARVEEVRIR
jgi:hypothetical protein